VLIDGHQLRAHHDGFQTIQLRAVGSIRSLRSWRGVKADITRLVRMDELVQLERGRLCVKLRCNELGAQVVSNRLQGQLPGWIHSLSIPRRAPAVRRSVVIVPMNSQQSVATVMEAALVRSP